MNAATWRRATSRVPLLTRITNVLKNRTGGRVRWRQSEEAPWRTINALVSAAKDMQIARVQPQMDMQIAAMQTQIALDDGAGEYWSTTLRLPSAGTKSCPPELPAPLI